MTIKEYIDTGTVLGLELTRDGRSNLLHFNDGTPALYLLVRDGRYFLVDNPADEENCEVWGHEDLDNMIVEWEGAVGWVGSDTWADEHEMDDEECEDEE